MNTKEAYDILIKCLIELHEAVKKNEDIYEWESDYHSALFYLLTKKINEKYPNSWQKQIVKFEDRTLLDNNKRIDITVYEKDNGDLQLLLLIEVKCDPLDNVPNEDSIIEDLKKLKSAIKKEGKGASPQAIFIYCGFSNRPYEIIKILKNIQHKYEDIIFALIHPDLEKSYIDKDFLSYKIPRNQEQEHMTKNLFFDNFDIYLLDFNEWDTDTCVKNLFRSINKKERQESRLYFYYTKKDYSWSPQKIASEVGNGLILILYNQFRSYKGYFVGFCRIDFDKRSKKLYYFMNCLQFINKEGKNGIRWTVPYGFNRIYEYFGIVRKYNYKTKKGERYSYPNLYKITGKNKNRLLNYLKNNVNENNWNEIVKKIDNPLKIKCLKH